MATELTDAVPMDDDIDQPDAEGADQADTHGDGDAATAGADSDALKAIAADADVDGDGDGDGAGDEKPDEDAGREQRIPKSRFNEVNEARKAAQQENAQLRELLLQVSGNKPGAVPAAEQKPRDFDSEYEALVTKYDAGDIDEAKFRRSERRLNLEQAKAEMAAQYEPKLKALQAQRDAEVAAALHQAWTKEVQSAIKAYPFLNNEDEGANAEAIAAVRAECEALMQAGITAPKALRLAVLEVAPNYATTETAEPKNTKAKLDEAVAERVAQARRALAEAENQQPAAMGGAGNGSRVQGKQHLTASVRDHDKWEHVPAEKRGEAFTA